MCNDDDGACFSLVDVVVVVLESRVYDAIFCRVLEDEMFRLTLVEDDLKTFIPLVVVVGGGVVRCSNMVRACRATKEQTKQ